MRRQGYTTAVYFKISNATNTSVEVEYIHNPQFIENLYQKVNIYNKYMEMYMM